MNNYFTQFLFTISIQIYFLFVFSTGTKTELRRFIVVPGYEKSGLSYPAIKAHYENSEDNLSKSSKKEICDDIITSDHFQNYDERPLKNASYIPLWCLFAKDNWPAQNIKVKVGNIKKEFDEKGFLCQSQYSANGATMDHYISAEYNLNIAQSKLAHIHLPGRFIFFDMRNSDTLVWAVAELPGEVYFSPDQSIEHLYLQRRASQQQMGNILCRLDKENIRRICVAVFNSGYFTLTDKVSFLHTRKVTADCGLQAVSFQTELGKVRADKHSFKEWMIDCKSKDLYDSEFNYLLSHAYESNQIFVYFRHSQTKEIFPENLTTQVRLSFTPQM